MEVRSRNIYMHSLCVDGLFLYIFNTSFSPNFVTVDPPKISPFSFPRDIQEGMRATITCSVFHGDQPISVSWLKDGHPIHPTSDLFSRSIDELTSTLVVQHITPKDNGNYTCVARNAAAAVNYTAQLLVLGKS